MATFPTLSAGSGLDSSKYKIEVEDNTIKQEVEGGYTYTRPRTTRRARLTWSIGYKDMADADKAVVMSFWRNVVAGNARIFQWLNPEDQVTYNVRFLGKLTWTYKGIGTLKRWDCEFQLQEV